MYVAVRVSNIWSGQQAVDLIESYLGHERAFSLEYRFMCEDLLVVKAVERPMLGWGAWGRSAVYFNADKPWRKMVETDGLWIIVLGARGFFGLTNLYLALILPAALFVWRFPARLWLDPWLASGTVAAVLLGLYIVDCLLNGFPNIIYITLAGGLAGIEPKQLRLLPPGSGSQAVKRSGSADQLALADRNRRLGRALKAEGRLTEAEVVWRQSLDLLDKLRAAYPNNPDLQQRCCDCTNDLVWLWVNYDTGCRDLKTAVAMARWIVEECPDAAIYWNTLGVAQYRAGDYAAAITRSIAPPRSVAPRPLTRCFWQWPMQGRATTRSLNVGSPRPSPKSSETTRSIPSSAASATRPNPCSPGAQKNALQFTELTRNQSNCPGVRCLTPPWAFCGVMTESGQ